MPLDAESFTEAILAIFNTVDESKYNIAPGFFQKYSTTVESDTSGKRFCDLKLHNKDDDGRDIGLLSVPLMYFGNKNFIVDFELEQGDDLLVLWSDRSIEQWKASSGATPQSVKNTVKDGFNHAMAIPICTFHNSASVVTIPNSADAGIRVKPGKKIEIGNGTDELLDILNQLLTLLQGPVDSVGSSSTGTNSLILADLVLLQTKLANIKS